MWAAVTTALAAVPRSHAVAVATTWAGFMVILLLTVLLATRELLRAHGGPRAVAAATALRRVILPLALATCVVVIQRLLGLMAGVH